MTREERVSQLCQNLFPFQIAEMLAELEEDYDAVSAKCTILRDISDQDQQARMEAHQSLDFLLEQLNHAAAISDDVQLVSAQQYSRNILDDYLK